ncbi:class I glutamine amidotransferase-like superfamily protein [Wolffia australiana]
MSSLRVSLLHQPSFVNQIARRFSRRSGVKIPRKNFEIAAMASTPDPKCVLVPVANGTEPMEAVIVIDVLRRAGADVTVASVEKDLDIEASWGVKLVADALLTDCSGMNFDLITIPGGMPGSASIRDCATLEQMVKKHAADGGLYAAICAAPAVVLGSWGLLTGLQATCYPSFMDKLPEDVIKVESRVKVDAKAITSRGAGTAMEFAVALVDQLYGKSKADEVEAPMVMRSLHGEEFNLEEFNPIEWKTDATPQVLVALADGVEEMEAVMIIDILRRAKANVVAVSIEDKLELVASRNTKLVADMLLEDSTELNFDLILLPGGLGGAKAFAASDKLMALLKEQAASGKLYGAVCASPALVLEPHGLLKGKKATSYPSMWSFLSDESESHNRVVVDGNLITSQGPGTSMEFALAVVQKLFGRPKAIELAKSIVFI